MSTPSDKPQPAAEPEGAGADLRLSLECPKCGASGWVEWKRLKHGMRCGKCGCGFMLGPSGKVLAESKLRKVRFTCPRCRQSGTIPSVLTIRGAECVACKLPLVQGTDQRLHGVNEAAEMRRAAQVLARRTTFRQKIAEKFVTADGKMHRASVVLAVLLALGLALGGAMLIRSLFDFSPQASARAFTHLCLAGDWDDAEEYVGDDDVQKVELSRWLRIHFSSIKAAYRPAGDKVAVEVTTLDESEPDRLVLQVKMTSSFFGTRTIKQHWRRDAETWFFDAVATLKF